MNLFSKWFGNKPIEQKLILSNLIVIILVSIPVNIIMLTYEYFALRSHLIEEIRIQSSIVAESTAAAVAFHDESAASETLSIFRDSPYLLEVHLVLPDNTILQSYFPTKKTFIVKEFKASTSIEESFTFSTMTIKKPIYLRQQFVGSVIMVNSLYIFYSRLIWYILIVMLVLGIGFIFARLLATRISKMIVKPLSELTDLTQKIMREKDYSTSITINNTADEFGSLSRSFTEMMSQIHSRDLNLKHLAYYDRVTSIPNRHFFEERISQSVDNAKKHKINCYLLMIDLDDFKIVNDTLGHHIGDLLLKNVSKKLSTILRKDDSIFRIGGDEFAILIENIEDNKCVKQIAQKIINAISTPVELEGHQVKVGASIGISSFPTYSHDVITLMSTADSAMYVAKGKGKNSFSVYHK
ncbi:MAG: diguanylate cyclase [Arcobacteraceae bacterium]|nr:diguanylate cyclase [Arcobacteraceae bacterium]